MRGAYFRSSKILNFCVFSRELEKIEATTSRTAITALLGELFNKSQASETKILAYLLSGELQPSYKRQTFNIADRQMFLILKEFFSKDDLEFFELEVKKNGDLGQAFFEAQKQILNNKIDCLTDCQVNQQLSLSQVYLKLEEIALCNGSGSVQTKGNLITELIKKSCLISAKFIIKIILGKLRLGFSEMTILDALSWTAHQNKSLKERLEKAFNVCADIGLIAQTLKSGGITKIDQIHAQVGIPIRPAAAERMESVDEIVKKLENFVAQPKLDGLRVQVHKYTQNGEPVVKLFSRNLQDITEMFPELSKTIKNIPAESLIAEGEAIGIDPENGYFLPFQDTAKRLRKHEILSATEKYPIKLYFFDLLFLKGIDLLSLPHKERRTLLEELLSKKERIFKELEIIEEKSFSTANCQNCAELLEEYFEKQIETGLEGLVIKRPEGTYQAGKRNFNWIKLKRLESSKLDDTIDCVIMGYYFGSGKRATFGIGALLAGIYDPETESIQSVCKIGTGLTDVEWINYKKLCDENKAQTKPKNFEVAKELEPDVWSQASIVVSVRADQISRSPIHCAAKNGSESGFALRFPRLISLRDDKSVFEATTSNELLQMYNNQRKKNLK